MTKPLAERTAGGFADYGVYMVCVPYKTYELI